MKGTKNNDEGYTSPYGDLQDSKIQNSTFSYESDSDNYGAKESRSRLVKKTSIKTEQQDNESGLAMAVVDILSCCDGRINPNETKILKNMQSRLHDQGSLISGEDDEEKQETFSDEYPRRPLLGKISPASWFFSSAKTSDNSTLRSSRSYIGPLQRRKDPVSQRKDSTRRKLSLAIGTVGAVLLIVGVMAVVKILKTGSVKSDNEQKPRDSNTSHPNTGCSIDVEEEYANVLSQCACQGSITTISDSANEKYEVLLQAFGAEYLHANETWHSCSTRNQALVWLSEDRGSKLSDVLYQRHILVLFFIRLNGLGWSFQEGQHKWLTPDHECTWFGVACNDNKEVTAIELWNMNLDGSLPRELMSLTTLETLSLPENKIKGALPTEAFIMMSKLTDLTLFMNSITGSIDGQIFKSATQLKILNLDSNDLTGTLASDIGELSNLEEIKLARNYIEGLLPTEIGKATLLQRIELQENNLVGSLPSEMGLLSQMNYLDISWNTLSGSIPSEFEGLTSVQTLLFKSNDLEGTLPAAITEMTTLENLILSLNAFTGLLPSGIDRMSSLSTLHLDGNKFGGKIPTALGSCSLLREVRLDYNGLMGQIPSEIGQLYWLVSFNIEGNSFSGTMPSEVCGLRGSTGTLETLSATCAAASDKNRNQEVFVRHNEFICNVPNCCTSCELRI